MATRQEQGRRGKGARLGQPRGKVPHADRLDDVIITAARIFREQGFRGTRLDDISDHLGVTRAALYYYFHGKREVLEAVCSRGMSETEAALEEVQSVEAADEQLRSFTREYARIMMSDPSRVFFKENAELEAGFRRGLMKRARKVTIGAEELLQRGVDQGIFRSDLNVPLTALGLLGMINAMADWHRPSRDGPADQAVQHLVEIFLRGIGSAKPAGRKRPAIA